MAMTSPDLGQITSRGESLEHSFDAQHPRTIQDIIWSCMATIFACAWVAIHPNLPDPRNPKSIRFLKRAGIMTVALIAPEFILIWALRQRLAAASIVKEYNDVVLGDDGLKRGPLSGIRGWFRQPSISFKRSTWTLTHGFYIQMGGLILYDKEADRLVRVIHLPDLLELIRSEAVDPLTIITEEDIWDKSKGDFITKLLVLLQTTWFIVQCIARWMAKLQVTELEVITLSFACLNIIAYILWWEKPQNINAGTRIEKEFQKSMQQSSAQVEERDVTDEFEEANLEQPHQAGIRPRTQVYDSSNHDCSGWQEKLISGIFWATVFLVLGGIILCYYVGKVIWEARLFSPVRKIVIGRQPRPVRQLDHVFLPSTWSSPREDPATTSIHHDTLGVGTFFASNGASHKGHVVLFAVACGGLFGGLHLISWNSPFPTHTEAMLWRASSLYIMANPILLSIPLALTVYIYKVVDDPLRLVELRPTARLLYSAWFRLFARIPALVIPFYILARFIIIIIGFSTLRGLSPDAYKEVPWTTFIPHI